MSTSEEKIVLTLDDHKKYVLVDNIVIDDIEYVYLVDIDDNKNLMICKLDGNNLTRITDNKLLTKILLELNQQK